MHCLRLVAMGVLAVTACAFGQTPGRSTPGANVGSDQQKIGSVRSEVFPPARPLDTRTFDPQIAPVVFNRFELKEHPHPFGNREVAPIAGLPRVGGVIPETRVSKPQRQWPAIGITGWNPPDPSLAVGPQHVVVTVNSTVAWYSKTGTAQFSQSFSSFFSGMGAGSFLFDPKAFYDRLSGRFFVTVLEQDGASQTSKVLVAVSDDGDPNGTWNRYRLESKLIDAGSSYWLDYPGFGFNSDAVVVSGNMFGFASGYAGVQFLVMPKAPLLSGTAVTVQYLRDTNAFTYQMAEMNQAGVGVLFGISDFNSSNAKWCAISNPTTTPTLTTGFLPIPSLSYPSVRAPSAGGRTLDPSDGRHLNASWQGNRLITTHTVDTAADTTNRVRWYEFNFAGAPATAPTLVQSGEIVSPTAGEHLFMPAVAKNGYGDISAIFSRSSSSIVADLMASGRLDVDPSGAMGTPALLISSSGSQYSQGLSDRWGDYFQINVDPTDNETFWGVGMVGNAAGNWQTHVLSWKIAVPLTSLTTTIDSLASGATTSATVKMKVPARLGGSVVSLTSSDPLVTVPATVTVAEGQSEATFAVTAGAPATTVNVTLTATLGASSVTKIIQVRPPVFAGTIGLQDVANTNGLPVRLELRTPGTTTVVATLDVVLGANGSFSGAAQTPGTYDVAVTSARQLRRVVRNLVVGANGINNFSASLLNGDVDGNNRITASDFAIVNRAFGATSASANWDERADLNRDGVVNAADTTIVLRNMRQQGDK